MSDDVQSSKTDTIPYADALTIFEGFIDAFSDAIDGVPAAGKTRTQQERIQRYCDTARLKIGEHMKTVAEQLEVSKT